MGAEHRVDVVRAVVSRHLPGWRVTSVEPLGAGLDNVTVAVTSGDGGTLVVRLARDVDALALEREVRLLELVADVSPLPVPDVAFADAELGCIAYPLLPGVPLLDVSAPPESGVAAVARALGGFLAALHSVAPQRVGDLVDVEQLPLVRWRDEAATTFADVATHVPPDRRAAIGAFLADPPPADEWSPAFSHNDLGIEHVLVDPGTWAVTGVIDWGDAALVDPARDLGLVLRDLGRRALDAALDAYGADPSATSALRRRAAFYARCSVLEDLAYGVTTGRTAYSDRSLAALSRLFPAPGGYGSGPRDPKPIPSGS